MEELNITCDGLTKKQEKTFDTIKQNLMKEYYEKVYQAKQQLLKENK